MDKGSNQMDRGSQEDHRTREPVREVESHRAKAVSSGKRERGHHSRKQRSCSPQGNGVSGGGKERDISEGDAVKRRSNSHNKALSLPRRLPTGDPMLHHMMQFQSLEAHGTLFSESDSNAETTSPIVSTCDEISESPEPPVVDRRAPEHPSDGVMHLQPHPASQTDQLMQPVKASQTGHRDGVRQKVVRERKTSVERSDQVEHNERVQDHSVSEERGLLLCAVSYICTCIHIVSVVKITNECVHMCECFVVPLSHHNIRECLFHHNV